MTYLHETPPFVKRYTIPLTFPVSNATILEQFRAHLRSPEAQAGPNGKRLIVIDSIASSPGVLLPWQDMVKICKEESVWSVIDAAHSIGQEPKIDLKAAAPDFWFSVGVFTFDVVARLKGHPPTELSQMVYVDSFRRNSLHPIPVRSNTCTLCSTNLSPTIEQKPAYHQDIVANRQLLHSSC